MSTELPPPGPERDRLVAEALGCTTWAPEDPSGWWGCFCGLGVEEEPSKYYPHDAAMHSSTSNHAALDALEAWKRGGEHPRLVEIELGVYAVVRLETRVVGLVAEERAPTLGDAASRAIIEATRREG